MTEVTTLNKNITPRINVSNYPQQLETITNDDPFFLLHKNAGEVFFQINSQIPIEDAFKQQLATVFCAYRDAKSEHLIRMGDSVNPDTRIAAITIDDFEKEYGRPPWEFVNNVLKTSELDFEIDNPSNTLYTDYVPMLIKLSKRISIPFTDLSSGEKVLMSFALAIYNAQKETQFKDSTKIILLDEVDAPLHPGMVKFLLNSVSKILVDELKLKVILTTHKPTTVALAPTSSYI